MSPTYSFSEIKSLVKSLDETASFILEDLIEEEKECYSHFELRAFKRFLIVKSKSKLDNDLKMDFLLSFN